MQGVAAWYGASRKAGTSAQVIVALGVGAEGALHARAPRRRNSEARSWLGQAHVPVACFGVPSRVGAPSPDPQRHAPGCAEVAESTADFLNGQPCSVPTHVAPFPLDFTAAAMNSTPWRPSSTVGNRTSPSGRLPCRAARIAWATSV